MGRFHACLIAALFLLAGHKVMCCVYKFGEHPGHPLSKPGDLHFTYGFAGDDWGGLCASGQQQSPINIPANTFQRIPYASRTIPDFGAIKSNGSNVKIFNNLHVLQVEWDDSAVESKATVAIPDTPSSVLTDTLGSADKTKRVTIRPVQFHLHGHSEHSISGIFYPLELHIVSQVTQSELAGCTGKLGCLAVVGIMYSLADDDADNELLKDFFDAFPADDSKPAYLEAGKTLDLNALLPTNKSYVTYPGSLTTPPCLEQVLWHVMLEPQTISTKQLKQFLQATGDLSCDHEGSGAANGNVTAQTRPASKPACKKLGAGQNYRIVQEVHNRTVLAYIDDAAPAKSSKSASSSAALSSSTYHLGATVSVVMLSFALLWAALLE